MKRILWCHGLSYFWVIGAVGLTAFVLARAFADTRRQDAEPPKPPPPVNVVQNQAPPNALPIGRIPDFGKGVIEMPTERLLAAQTVPGSAPAGGAFVNPKVEPGKVHWHKTFEAACEAARKSGKPALLFQMMGNLDERFC
jgi:hypothetical protein